MQPDCANCNAHVKYPSTITASTYRMFHHSDPRISLAFLVLFSAFFLVFFFLTQRLPFPSPLQGASYANFLLFLLIWCFLGSICFVIDSGFRCAPLVLQSAVDAVGSTSIYVEDRRIVARVDSFLIRVHLIIQRVASRFVTTPGCWSNLPPETVPHFLPSTKRRGIAFTDIHGTFGSPVILGTSGTCKTKQGASEYNKVDSSG